MSTTDVKLDEKIKIRVEEPKRWKVVFINDNSTPMEFVASILVVELLGLTLMKLQKSKR